MKDFLISFILESIVNIGEIFLFYLLLNHKFQLKKADVSSRLKLFSFLLLQVLILSTFNCTSTSMIVILAFLLGTDILFALLFFECSLMQSILWSGIYAIIGLFADYACILLPCAIAGVDANASLFGGSLHVPITFLHLIILAVIILILIHLNTKTLSFTGLQRCVYVLLSVFGTFVAYYLLSIVLHYTAGISEKNLIDELILILFAFLFVDLFDTIGTLVGVSAKADMLDKKGKLPHIKGALLADAVATTVGAILGTSTTTTFVESASGVSEGGRTGLTAVTTAILFGLSLFLSPIFLAIPSFATAPALVIVGLYMLSNVTNINFTDMSEAIPAYVCIIAMPFFYSISEGISMGIISYVVINLITGEAKDKKISALMYVLAILFILKYIFL